MNIKFDHIVFFVHNLDQAVLDFKQKGFHVVYGGSHPMWGTYNALIYFSSYYIELIAIENEAIFKNAATKPYTLHETIEINQRNSGLTRLAFRTNNSLLVAQNLQKNQFLVEGPETFSRNTPAGTTISWTLIHSGQNNCRSLPFIIDWQKEDEVRFKELEKNGTIAPHQNEVTAIQSIIMPLKNSVENINFLNALNIPFSQSGKTIKADLQSITIVYDETCITPEIRFVGGDSSASFTYEGTLFHL